MNRQADNLNDMRLNQIMLDPHEFHAETAGPANLVDRLKKNMLAPERLILKEGAAVMALRNDTDRQYVNGSLGTVRGFAQENKGGWPAIRLGTAPHIPCLARRCASGPCPHGQASCLAICGW